MAKAWRTEPDQPEARARTVRDSLALRCCVFMLLFAGCSGPSDTPELVWGRHGVLPGELHRPRAAAIDGQDRIYVVDFTARIQVYDRDGNYLGRGWTTPDYRNGRPSGLSIDRDGNLLLCDSH